MWQYVVRKLLWNIPVYLGILLVVMLALRVNDPVWGRLGKNATQEQYDKEREKLGLKEPFIRQYGKLLWGFDLGRESWDKPGRTVGEELAQAVWPSFWIALPALVLTTLIALATALVAAFRRGRALDRGLMAGAVVGMSISYVVYIILGQYFGAYRLSEWTGRQIFAIQGYDTKGSVWWAHFCLLPVLINTVLAVGYDSRFYRAVIVEEVTRDHVRTARAKGLTERAVMLKHVLRNALISVITHVMITLPFLIAGEILIEVYFNIPGMGRTLITAILGKDFPMVQGFTAVFAAVFIVTNILTDVLYALVDPRVRLS
ncbi:MAG TPA: ABC transporter permease [Planctomycetota bacterium]|nr:ABC transporter permease [Planctomycetota bacterium]